VAVDHFALFASVDTLQGFKVFVVSMLLALTIGRLRETRPAMRRAARRRGR
jgi:hypothetical protein